MRTDKKQWRNRKARKELARQLQSENPGLEVLHPHAAGIDVGNSAHYVAVRPDRDPQPVRRFECFTADLHRWRTGCKAAGCRPWPYSRRSVLDSAVRHSGKSAGSRFYLVNARHTKNLPGRKSDVQESQWLLKLHTLRVAEQLVPTTFKNSDPAHYAAAVYNTSRERRPVCSACRKR